MGYGLDYMNAWHNFLSGLGGYAGNFSGQLFPLLQQFASGNVPGGRRSDFLNNLYMMNAMTEKQRQYAESNLQKLLSRAGLPNFSSLTAKSLMDLSLNTAEQKNINYARAKSLQNNIQFQAMARALGLSGQGLLGVLGLLNSGYSGLTQAGLNYDQMHRSGLFGSLLGAGLKFGLGGLFEHFWGNKKSNKSGG